MYNSLIRPRGPSPSLISPHGRKHTFVCVINWSHIVKRFDPQIPSSSKCTSSALLPIKKMVFFFQTIANQKRLVHHVVDQSVELESLKGETKLPMP